MQNSSDCLLCQSLTQSLAKTACSGFRNQWSGIFRTGWEECKNTLNGNRLKRRNERNWDRKNVKRDKTDEWVERPHRRVFNFIIVLFICYYVINIGEKSYCLSFWIMVFKMPQWIACNRICVFHTDIREFYQKKLADSEEVIEGE